MAKTSAGLLLYDVADGEVRVLLVHPGGPLWSGRDEGAWSVPKGEHGAGEDPHEAAIREVTEELGSPPPPGEDLDLGEVVQRGGKHVRVWARRGRFDPSTLRSNTFEMEWPPRSGRRRRFPEVDRAEWFPLAEARRRILPSQAPLLDRLEAELRRRGELTP